MTAYPIYRKLVTRSRIRLILLRTTHSMSQLIYNFVLELAETVPNNHAYVRFTMRNSPHVIAHDSTHTIQLHQKGVQSVRYHKHLDGLGAKDFVR